MTLRKGFLRPQPIIDPGLIGAGVALGTLLSFGLYGFFYHFREAIRLLASQFGGGTLIELSPQENFFYNHFYGSIAAILGLHFIVKFVVENSIRYQHKKAKRRQRHILNEQAFVSWTFLLGFGRWLSIVGIWYLTFPLQFDIDFFREFPGLLAMIPAVLFLSIWPTILRAMGRGAYRWLGYSLGYVALLSFAYANFNFIDYQQANEHLKAPVVELSHDLALPLSSSQQSFDPQSLVCNLYVVQDSSQASDPLIFGENAQTPLLLNEVASYIKEEKEEFPGFPKSNTTINLLADRRIPFSFIRQLRQIFRQERIQWVQYSTGAKHSKYPSHYPLFKDWGLRQPLFIYYSSLETFLDSAEQLDFSRRQLKLPASPMYRIPSVRQYNRLEIRITPYTLLLKGEEVSKEKLKKVIYQFAKKYAPNYVLIYRPDEAITYGRYIEHLDLLYSTIDGLRNELSLQRYDQVYQEDVRDRTDDTIAKTYPRSVIEWTPEEEGLLRLMEKEAVDR